ncbi:MAG: SDR family NAD(P)-dependent oxidoreductase, partial [Shewanella sp.]
MTQATAIIVGASSHLSRELAKQLAEQQVELALFAQDVESLREFASTLPTKVQVFSLQIEQPSAIIEQLENVWQSLGGAHLVLVNTGLNSYD